MYGTKGSLPGCLGTTLVNLSFHEQCAVQTEPIGTSADSFELLKDDMGLAMFPQNAWGTGATWPCLYDTGRLGTHKTTIPRWMKHSSEFAKNGNSVSFSGLGVQHMLTCLNSGSHSARHTRSAERR